MRLHGVMRNLEGGKDQLDKWKSLEMFWMSVDSGTLALREENLHSVMDIQMAVQFGRGWIERLLR